MKLEALFNAVIVKPVEVEETMYGNIVVPDMGKEKNQTAEVIAVGPGHYSITGDNFIKTTLSVGDKVILPTMGYTKLEWDGEELLIGKENDILAKINN
jgi:chaperonin GroES|tara:strand:- start:250 stop:543 length:294 start_codon:yes stop_codon:yes gene_type:complete